ncbi:MAG: hydantoinase B/oxoprolinase family protein [Burkholderiales bacterium]
MSGTFDAIRLQLMWDRLLSVVEEQAQTLIRVGFSTSTREAGDVSAGIFDPAGNMLAQAVTGTPGHVNAMARAVRHFLAKFPAATMRPGDVFATNDPWKGTGHLNDFTFVTPAFRRDRLVALFASTSHVVDIGGLGMSSDARDVFEEGLYVPLVRFARAGQVDETLLELVRANVRAPDQVIGDLYSLVTCNEVGARRLFAMLDEFGVDDLGTLGPHILERSGTGMRQAIARLAPGVYRASMRVDGYDRPVDLVATTTIARDAIEVDFTGSSPISAAGINVPFCYTEAYAAFGVKCIVAPAVPNNEGSLATIRIRAPEGSILNAAHPAPVAVRHVVGQMLPDVIFGCLAQALPGGVPAEGASCNWTLYLFGGPGRVSADPAAVANARAFSVLAFHSGGMGARPTKDGLAATAFPSGVRNTPVEVTEAISPIVVWRKEFRGDSGGPGRYRGGLGQTMELENLDGAPFTLSAYYDRIDYPARGRDGGHDGAPGEVRLASGATLRGKGLQTIPAGERVVFGMPGGAGYGDPRERDPHAVAADVRAGLVSISAARTLYAVAVDDAGRLDESATARLRGTA